MSESSVATAVDSDSVKTDSPAPKPPSTKLTHREVWLVIVLTVFSAVLCFNRLSFPSLLIDESFTFWRTCGTTAQMFETLRNDGFVPLHYILLNWMHHGFPLGFGIRLVRGGIYLTPAAIRFPSALAATLMTPVMYFLARQIFNRRTALIAALFIACSAYGLFFSHYAKMYAGAWMFETLMVACCVWWIRTWSRLAWACWILSGIAATGYHAVTLLIVPLAPLYFISMGKFGGSRIPRLLAGLMLIVIGPAIYYGFYNQWIHNSGGIVPGVMGRPAPDAQWAASGLDWLEQPDNSLQPPFEALNSYLSGYEWKTLDDLKYCPEFVEKFSAAMIALAVVTYAVFIFGALPWPHLQKANDIQRSSQPWWRSLLWLSFWLVMPVYGFFYCRSVEDFSSPMVWVQALGEYLRPVWWEALLGAALIAAMLAFLPAAAKFVAFPLLAVGLCVVGFSAWNKFDWLDYANRPVIQLSALALVTGLVFHYSGATIRQRFIELLRLLAVAGVILICCELMFLLWTWLQKVSEREHPELPWQSVWHVRYIAIVWPAVWLAAAALVARLPTRILRIVVVLMICSYNLANGLAREYCPTEPPLDRVLADVYRSQADSPTRTYFDMHPMFDNTLYRPQSMYNACLAARLDVTPAEFRVGSSWPFEYGTAADEFKSLCVYNSSISSRTIAVDLQQDPRIARVIIWEAGRFGEWSWTDDDATDAGLTGKWTKKSDEQIICHWPWDWHNEWYFHRVEFDRK